MVFQDGQVVPPPVVRQPAEPGQVPPLRLVAEHLVEPVLFEEGRQQPLLPLQVDWPRVGEEL